ncbi:MAG: phosphoribosylamine--glycine ligase [Planctomycetes bacterium]|nr:phosphoribosylamine--glycine ligase [Planctomycetota bacterium]
MKVLVVGGGGREHALVWKIARSPLVSKVYSAPGNAGIAEEAEAIDIAAGDVASLLGFAKDSGIDLTVVGPEVPLVAGIVDKFQEEGLKIFGPRQHAANLEGSKAYSKMLMKSAGIPTARFKILSDLSAAKDYAEVTGAPIVIKASGLAAGKGVYVCKTIEEAHEAIDVVMKERIFGTAGDSVIIEECLTGEEASILAFVDGHAIFSLESSQDHKRAFDGDKGPNTGGMGAYSPAPVVTDRVMRQVERDVLVPVAYASNRNGCPYRGILYAGLMITEEGPSVLEFNVRFGDPETQPILMRMKSDIMEPILAVIDGSLADVAIEWDERPAVCVVMASGGYPGKYEKGKEITGIEEAEALGDVKVFHAGTALAGDKLVTNGGRVLGVTALGDTIAAAKERAYEAVGRIHFDGAHFRSDIADRAIRRA